MICDKQYRLAYTERAKALVSQMTLDEKIHLMGGNMKATDSMGGGYYNAVPYGAGGCARLGIPEMMFCDGPRGCVSGHSTCFPVPMARGATFDPELETRVGIAIAKEIRANGGNFFGGVCVNLPYNPGGGRSQESYSEDSWHMGVMGAAQVQGIQSQNVMACVKHYAFNSMERSRFKVDVTASKRTEREQYLPHFKKCVDAGAASVMSAYNKYQGSYCGQSKYLLRQVLKDEWDFDGFVISDFMWGTRSTAGAISGGQDIEMHVRNYFKPEKVKKELAKGTITEAMIDEAAIRIVRTILAFSEAEDPQDYPKELIACNAHAMLAREVAEKSITLIKNNGMLPLSSAKIKTLALVGDLAAYENIGDHGSSQVRPPYIVTLKEALEKNYPDVNMKYIPTKEVKKNTDFIKSADAVVIVCGCKHNDEGEYIFYFGGDRKNLGLNKRDLEMVHKVSALNKSTAVVLMGGNAILVHEWKDKVAAILLAYYPGQEGGGALADILWGKVNPSGKLPFTIAESAADYPQVNWNTKAAFYDYYHDYQKLDKERMQPDYPYGFGLSYTQFALSDIKLESANSTTAEFSVKVKNIGKLAGGEVAQLYIGFEGSAVDRPVKILRDFKKVWLNPGEEARVVLRVSKCDLAYYDEANSRWEAEDIYYTAYIGSDSASAMSNSVKFKFEN